MRRTTSLSILTPKANAIWGTAPAWIAAFHCYDSVDEVFVGTLRTRPAPALGRKQQAALSFPQHPVEMEQSGRLQNDCGTENACRTHEKSAQAGDDTVRGARVGRTLAAAIEDQQLMPDQCAFGDNGVRPALPAGPG
jgi:hypothetical protein